MALRLAGLHCIPCRVFEWKLPALLLLVSAPAWGQVSAPMLGYVPDGGQVRAVNGIPVGAAIQAVISNGHTFAQIAISPLQDYGIASDAATGSVFLLNFNSPVALPGAAPSPAQIVISPQGSSAALWFPSGKLQIFSGMPNAPRLREVNAAVLDGAPAAMAVSDDGSLVVGSWPDGLYSFGPNGELARIPIRARPSALTFYSGNHDLAAATSFGVISIAGVGGAAVSSTLYSASLQPAGIAVTAGNHYLIVADFDGSLITINPNSASNPIPPSKIDCRCVPDGVFPMGPSAFRITEFNGATFKVLDTVANQIFFVPLAGGVQ
jgi:hypothetical protein